MIKKIQSLIIIFMFIGITTVYAENVKIESITLDSKSDRTEIISEPTYEGLSIRFNLKFVEVNDYAKYKIIINNQDNEDYEIEGLNDFKSSKYVAYSFNYDNSKNKIEKNSKSTVYVTIKYVKEVEDTLVDKTGKYTEYNSLVLNLGNDNSIIEGNPVSKKIEQVIDNPSTGDRIVIAFIAILLITGIFLILKKHNKQKYINVLIITMLMIPTIVFALNKIKITIDSTILIEKKINIIESRYVNNNTNVERDFWQYYQYIYSITFKNKIEKPEEYEYEYDVSDKKDKSVMAYLVGREDYNYDYDLYIMADGNIYANPDSSYVFNEIYNLKVINNIEYYRTINAENMSYMFGGVSNLESLDLSHFDTRNVTNMRGMFTQNYYGGQKIEELDLSSFDTSKVTDMSNMFYEYVDLKVLNISSFDTSKVTDMSNMFSNCKSLMQLDLSSFDTSKVTNMKQMFYFCESLKQLNVNNFDTSNVTNMNGMFEDIIISELDLSSFDTSKVIDMSYMFSYSGVLKHIYVSDKWNVDNVSTSNYMFSQCLKLPNYDENIVDKTKANTSSTGYLTLKV